MLKRILFSAFLLCNSMLWANEQPNIVVIMADDIGSADVSYYTRQFMKQKPAYETPNIDQLAHAGIWFTDGHSATALCAPTRYAIMSGKNNYRSYSPWGVWGLFRENAIGNDEVTLAKVVKQQGYNTGFIGKWHLGSDFLQKDSDKIYRGDDRGKQDNVDLSKIVGGGAKEMGFDYSFMLPDGIQGPTYLAYENDLWYPLTSGSKIAHIDDSNVYDKRMISDKGDGMGDTGWRTEHIGELISQKAVDFIQAQQKNQPFMLYYATPMAHLPHMPPATFDGIKVAGSTGSANTDMIKEMDLQVGRIIHALKSSGHYDNTLILFVSDNGGLRKASSGIYRGSKNMPHEGGHRTPFIAVWPGKITHNQLNNELVVVQDVLATIAAAAGHPLNKEQAPDSNNLLPLLLGETGFKPRQYVMMQGGSRHETIFRMANWKLIMQSDNKVTKFEPVALFDLAANISENEAQNLINLPNYQDRVNDMHKLYLEIRHSARPTAW